MIHFIIKKLLPFGRKKGIRLSYFYLPLSAISAIITTMMAQKTYRKTLCLIYILTLFFWGICSGASSVSEIAETVCGEQDCYVNHSAVITSAARHIPAQEYLSMRHSNPSETLSAGENRVQRHLTRSVRQIAALLLSNDSSAGSPALSGLLLAREIPAHSSCGITITNYIHLKDGQKSSSFFTRFTMV